MWAITRIAVAEFAKAFAPRVGTPAARDFLWLTVFFTLSAFIAFVGWSARNGIWDRFEQVLLGALPEGGPPIRVRTHIDVVGQGISPETIARFERDFPGLGIVPMRTFDGRTEPVFLPGFVHSIGKSLDAGDLNERDLSWGAATDGTETPFLGLAVPDDSPLWRWISQRSSQSEGLGEGAPLVIAANYSLFRKHFRFGKYRDAVVSDLTASCGVRRELSAEPTDGGAGTPASGFTALSGGGVESGDLPKFDTLWLKVREWSGGDGRSSYQPFKVIWIDSFPLPERVAMIMPLRTLEVLDAAQTWSEIDLYLEGRALPTRRVSTLYLKDMDGVPNDDDRSKAVKDFEHVARCLGAIPVEQREQTMVCGAKWTPEIINDSVVKTENAPRTLSAGESAVSVVPLLGRTSFDMLIKTSSQWPLKAGDVKRCLEPTRFKRATENLSQPSPRAGDMGVTFTRDSTPVLWKGPSRIELPCIILTAPGPTFPLIEKGSCAGADLEGARGIGRLPGYNDAMIYAGAPRSVGSAPHKDASPAGSLDDIVKSVLDWKVDDGHFAFRLDPAYESALVRFGVLSTIVDKMALPIGGGMVVLYFVLSGVILATTFLHRRSQYGLLFMNGVRPFGLSALVLIQIALACTIGCIVGYALFLMVALNINDWLKTTEVIHKASSVIGLFVPTFLDNLTPPSIVAIWLCMIFAQFSIATVILRFQKISTAQAPIDLIN